MELYKRIKELREERHMSQEELALKTGYTSRTSIAKIEAGKIDLPQSKIVLFAKALNTTASYLMGWESESSIPAAKNILPLPKTKKVPLIGTIACGTPILAEENIDGYVDAPDHIQADFCLRCQGDSMINARIMDGDVVLIRKQQDVDDGQIAAVLIEDEATLKRVYHIKNGVTLIAENPAYSPMTITADDCLTVCIIGKAVAFISGVK